MVAPPKDKKCESFSGVPFFVTVAHQAPLSMGLSSQKGWSG